MSTGNEPHVRVLTLKEVAQRTSLHRTTIWRLRRTGAFPMHIQLTTGRIGWFEHKIDAWLTERGATAKHGVSRTNN